MKGCAYRLFEKVGDLGERRGDGGKFESGIIGALAVVASPIAAGGVRLFGPIFDEARESHRGPATVGETGVMGKSRPERAPSNGKGS